ncbi:MAG: hypothetical protein LLG93_08840 [Deltaproteobacteria bacterium]|nr:hypothetical protein [Deltaproteobacteria bacterium]
MERRYLIVPLTILLLSLPVSLPAQGEIAEWFGPDLGKSKAAFSYRATVVPSQDVERQNTGWRATDHDALLYAPIRQDENSEWSAAARLKAYDVKTDAVLPSTGGGFPGTLWDMEFGSLYRRRLENGWIGGIATGVGSASDKPFQSFDETTLDVTAFTRIPDGGRNAWLVLVNFNNNREFLRNIPLPGVGYWYEPGDRFRAIIGVPFLYMAVRPISDVTLDLAYFPIRRIHAGASYLVLTSVKLYGAFDWRTERYFRADRTDRDRRLFYYEKRLAAGCQWRTGEHLTLDLSGGYAFDRMFFEGEDYGDRDFNRIDIASGPFISIQAAFRF